MIKQQSVDSLSDSILDWILAVSPEAVKIELDVILVAICESILLYVMSRPFSTWFVNASAKQ